jgi:hypothetical protein
MTIYEPLVAEGYEWVNCYDDSDYEVFLSLDGSPRAGQWEPVKVQRVRANEKQKFTPSDFPWLGADALVMRRRAVDALRDILDAHGEVLPLATDDNVELFVFNARAVDALDETQSTVMRFSGTNRIMDITQVAFIAPMVRGRDIFRLPHRASSTYVSQRFVDRVNAAGLVGLEFNRVWSSE